MTTEDFFINKVQIQEKNFLTKSFFFTEHLIFQNFYMNLISYFSTKVLYKNHFFDSLTPVAIFYSFWPRNKPISCIDVGSGGGFPGLVLSIFFPAFFFCLFDSINKKTRFHKIFLSSFQIQNSKSVCQRAEIIGKFLNHRQIYDFTITRAVAELNILAKLCLPLTKENGKLIILKKINSLNQELKASYKPLKISGGKLKCFVHINSLKQGKLILMIRKN